MQIMAGMAQSARCTHLVSPTIAFARLISQLVLLVRAQLLRLRRRRAEGASDTTRTDTSLCREQRLSRVAHRFSNDATATWWRTRNHYRFLSLSFLAQDDFEGHDNRWISNVVAYIDGAALHNGYGGTIGDPGQGILDGHEHYFFNNTVALTKDDPYVIPICRCARRPWRRGLEVMRGSLAVTATSDTFAPPQRAAVARRLFPMPHALSESLLAAAAGRRRWATIRCGRRRVTSPYAASRPRASRAPPARRGPPPSTTTSSASRGGSSSRRARGRALGGMGFSLCATVRGDGGRRSRSRERSE